MSLPMRNPLKVPFDDANAQMFIEDAAVRYFMNVPAEDLFTRTRLMFVLEEAFWLYYDKIILNKPTSSYGSIFKYFLTIVSDYCPAVVALSNKNLTRNAHGELLAQNKSGWTTEDIQNAVSEFKEYKSTIPVRGCCILNKTLDKILLVEDATSKSWSFPRGKIGKDEDDVKCAIRECKEETGLDLSDYIRPDKFMISTINRKQVKIYFCTDVPTKVVKDFNPMSTYEISDMKWFKLDKIKKLNNSSQKIRSYLFGTFMYRIFSFVKRESLERKFIEAEHDLKRILNIEPSETSKVNNGAALLSMMKAKNSPDSNSSMTPVSSGANVLNMLNKSSSVTIENGSKTAAANDLLSLLKTGSSKDLEQTFKPAEQMKPSNSNASSLLSVLKQDKPQNAPIYNQNNMNAFQQQHYPNNFGTPIMQNNQQMNLRQTPQSMGPPMYMSPNLMGKQPMMMNNGMPPMQHMNPMSQMGQMNQNPAMFMNQMMNQNLYNNNMMSPQQAMQQRGPNQNNMMSPHQAMQQRGPSQNNMMNPHMNGFNNSPQNGPLTQNNTVEEPQGNENPRKALLSLLSAEQEEKQVTNSNSLLNLLNQNKHEKKEEITSNDELFSLLNNKRSNNITNKMNKMSLEDSDSDYESFSTQKEAILPDETI